MNLILLYVFFVNYILAKKTKKESRVFCRYNYNGVNEVYDPAYFDEKGNIVYATSIEEYAKILGPTWYGVSWCNNSTMVNSIGIYYDISSVQNKLRKRENQSSKEENLLQFENDNKISDNPFSREDNTIEDYNNRTATYIDNIYNKLKQSKRRCVPLISRNPRYNPYHKSLIIGIEHPANFRYATGGNIKISENHNDIISNIPEGMTKCASVSHCDGCNVICNVIISASNEKQYSITNSIGNVSTNTIGNINSNTDTFTDEISNTIDLNVMTDMLLYRDKEVVEKENAAVASEEVQEETVEVVEEEEGFENGSVPISWNQDNAGNWGEETDNQESAW